MNNEKEDFFTTSAIVIGVGLLATSSFSPLAIANESGSSNTEATEKSQIVQAQDVMKIVEVDELNTEISIPLDLHLEQSDTQTPKTEQKEIITGQSGVVTQQHIGNDLVYALYETSENNAITVAESQEVVSLEEAASWYNESEVSFIEINGHKALLEDGVRRTIHLASDKKFFTISGANVSVDLLVEIVEKIDI